MIDLRRKVADNHNEIRRVLRLAQEGDDTVLRIVAVDPLEAVPLEIHLPERLVLAVHTVELPRILQELRMHRILLHEMPVQAVIEVPLDELPELAAHEQELLARMRDPIAEERPEIRELLPVVPRHLADERALAMHRLIMRERQHEILRERIHERERDLVLVPFPIDRVKAHIVEHIIHPAHVPLVVEAHAAHEYRLRDQRPGGRFLRDHERVRMILEYRRVQLLDEIHCLEIARIAVFVRLPFAILARIVQIQHIRHRVDAQPIDMILLEPEHRVRDEEAVHLRAAIVEIRRAPFPVLRPLLIVRLVERLPVKMPQPLLILAEMARHPVHDDRDAVRMRLIHQIHEILRLAIAARDREIARRLIAPGAIIRMLAERHELKMRIMHLLRVADELIRQVTVAQVAALQRAPPGAQMHLIDEHRLLIGAVLLFRLIPGSVVPLIASQLPDTGRRMRFFLRKEAVGIRLQDMRPAPLRLDCILIDRTGLQPGNERAPDLTIADALHRMDPRVPLVEIPDHAHRLRMRRPDGETHAGLPILLHEMGPQHLIRMIIGSLMV